MSTASALAHQSRLGAHLTQEELGSFANICQSAVARAESGKTGLTVDVLERLVRAAGWRLTVLPTRASTAADAAETIAGHLDARDQDGPYRAIIQLADDLAREHGAERVALTVTPPRSTGDLRYDAFLAGVVETRLSEEDLPNPRWLAQAARLRDDWYVDSYSRGDQSTIDSTPPALRARGVIIDATELQSV